MSSTRSKDRTSESFEAVDISRVTFHDFADLDRPELNEPGMAEQVAAIGEEMEQEDRKHAMSLAMLRKALSLTQNEVAARLGIGQSAVVRTEKADDMLVSTLRKYLEGVGAHLSLVVHTPDGSAVKLELSEISEVETVDETVPSRPVSRTQ